MKNTDNNPVHITAIQTKQSKMSRNFLLLNLYFFIEIHTLSFKAGIQFKDTIKKKKSMTRILNLYTPKRAVNI